MPDTPCPMHAQLEHKVDSMQSQIERKIDAIHEDIRSMLERMSTFQTAVAVHTSEIAQTRKDIDALAAKDREERIELVKRLDNLDLRTRHIETMLAQLEGVKKTIKVLWLVFGASSIPGLVALLRQVL